VQNESIRYLVPESVEEIIQRENLIGSNRNNVGKLAKTCAELASNKKAEDIVVLDCAASRALRISS